jgi:hypothetical protein
VGSVIVIMVAIATIVRVNANASVSRQRLARMTELAAVAQRDGMGQV